MKRLLSSALDTLLPVMTSAVLGICLVWGAAMLLSPPSDSFVRKNVYQLMSPDGNCTGTKVLAPSGTSYIITAAHCNNLIKDNKIDSYDVGGVQSYLEVIQISPDIDLMLLSSPDKTGLQVGSMLELHQAVHTIAHNRNGLDMMVKAYRRDGEYLGDTMLVPLCTPAVMFNEPVACSMHSITTVQVMPGNSGGPLLDNDNHLIGIISNLDYKGFSYHVTPTTIKEFLKDR